MAKTKEQYQQEFKAAFQDPSSGWRYAKAIQHVLVPYITEHAIDVFEAAGFSKIKEEEKGRAPSWVYTRVRAKQKKGLGDDPNLAVNTYWAVEAVLIKGLIDLGNFDLTAPATLDPSDIPTTFLTGRVKLSNGKPYLLDDGMGSKYVPHYSTRLLESIKKQKPGLATVPVIAEVSVFSFIRTTGKWTSLIKEALSDDNKTIVNPGDARGWWKDVLSSNEKDEVAKALAEAGVKADKDLLDDPIITDEEDIKAERKFQEQCFLIDNYQKICSHNVCEPYGKYFTCIGGKNINPASVISRIVAPQDVDPLMTAPQEVFARLQPRVRIFKRYRVKRKPVWSHQERVAQSSAVETAFVDHYYQPQDKIVQKEIRFADHDSKTSIEKAFAPREGGYSDGVGLRRFEWTYYGSNPYEADRSIICKMTLFFRNIEDLYASDSTGGGRTATFLDLILFGPEKNVAPNPNPYGVRFNKWDPDYYELKASIGYHAPPNDELLDGKGKKLRDTLKNSSVTLGLILTGHAFNFNEDGSGTLEIDFQGIIESHLSSTRADLFYTSKRLVTEIKKLDKDIEIIDKLLAADGKSCEEGGLTVETTTRSGQSGAGDAWYDFSDWGAALIASIPGLQLGKDKDKFTFIKGDTEKMCVAREKLVERRNRFTRNSKVSRYSTLVNRLIALGKIKYIEVNHQLLGIISASRYQMSKDLSAKRHGKGTKRKFLDVEIKSADSAKLKEKHEKYLESAAGAIEAADDAAASKKKKKKAKESFEPAKDKKVYRVNYFYLGDLLEAAFYMAKDDPKISGLSDDGKDYTFSNIHFLLGPITFVDPRTHKPIQINLADLPVSLNMFMTWYLDNVISPQVDTYYLRNFIRDVVTSLILEVLSPACFYQYPVRPRFNITSISGPGLGKGSKSVDRVGMVVAGKRGRKKTSYRKGGRLTETNHIAPYPNSMIGQNPPREFFYDFIYCQDGIPWDLNGVRKDDAKKGIYHFQIGSDEGILKNVTFDRIDQPYVREARTVSDGSDPIAAQLRLQYNVTLKCFGTTLFKPGMRIHILPRLAGNVERSLTYKLGLGGYVFLTKVENIIEPGRFETILYGINDGMVKRAKGGKSREAPHIVDCRRDAVEEKPTKKSTARQSRSGVKIETPRQQKADQEGIMITDLETSSASDAYLLEADLAAAQAEEDAQQAAEQAAWNEGVDPE